jgi:hypothetical protein
MLPNRGLKGQQTGMTIAKREDATAIETKAPNALRVSRRLEGITVIDQEGFFLLPAAKITPFQPVVYTRLLDGSVGYRARQSDLPVYIVPKIDRLILQGIVECDDLPTFSLADPLRYTLRFAQIREAPRINWRQELLRAWLRRDPTSFNRRNRDRECIVVELQPLKLIRKPHTRCSSVSC